MKEIAFAGLIILGSLPAMTCSAQEAPTLAVDKTSPATADTPRAVAGGMRSNEASVKIRVRAGDRRFSATLEDSPAARDFAAGLPMTLTLRDYASTEKIATLPRRLTTSGASDGADPAAGDLAYYAPWGNIAIYYRDFGYSPGLVRLGRVDGDPAALEALSGEVILERAN